MDAAATYKQFLVSPSTALLADKASLHYVTTTTSFNGSADIIKHLLSLQKQVSKKKQHVLNAIQGQTAAVFEVDTTLEFHTSGGVFLPGLDDNFLTDRAAQLAITHIVDFDANGKIVQMRQQWDQGAVLRQLDIIGRSGRNWPIRDSREQLAMVQSCLEATDAAGYAAPSQTSNANIRMRAHANPLRDPHASLQLFGSREELEAIKPETIVSPYAGSRPRQRGVADIFGHELHESDSGAASAQPPMSPSKAGFGKNQQPMRIFDGHEHYIEQDEDENLNTKSGKPHIRPDPRKYHHFDFVDGSDAKDKPRPGMSLDERPRSKHDSQWSFDDFVTPQKPKPSKTFRHQDIRHWDVEPSKSDEVEKPTARARRDAETHFEFQDDGERVPRQPRPGAKPRGAVHNEGLGLYKNNLFNQEPPTPGPKRALGNITNLKDRTKDFDAHFAMTDDSPSQETHKVHNIPEGRMKAVKMMDANWANYDQSPAAELKENQSQPKGNSRIHIAGDGMGGKKGAEKDWLHGGEGGDKERIHIAGDGMGGKKGTNRDWLYGDGDNDDDEAPKAPLSRRPGPAQAVQSTLWDM
ncbi:hypothetical protein CDD82_5116 [Ophiocordyceps australis]|uniref:NTF2 domain-containing protein n=1 Tax=Ophiocordyceps australis TaxID=1399860 RepID=A0A2C5Z3X8_9HYPO|nr:hypothetical protein CDD82_5116 [Ophiocordyceps australis]